MNDTARLSLSIPTYKRIGISGALVAFLFASLFIAHQSSYDQGLLLVGVSFAILALSLDLVAGTLGLFSLGHAGLFAIGAYTTTILVNQYDWNVFVVVPVVMVIDGVVGSIIGALSLRVSGLYFAIVTYVFTLMIDVVLSYASITGGYEGLLGPTFPSYPSTLSWLGNSQVWAINGAFLFTMVILWSIRSSAMYPVLLATRDAEQFAASAGVRVAITRVAMVSLSAALAGLAGWTFCFLGYISPGQFGGTASINILVMVILGGMNTRLGPIFGAFFISLFPVVVNWNPLWQEVFFGSIFIFVIVLIPEGFIGMIARLARTLQWQWQSRVNPAKRIGIAQMLDAVHLNTPTDSPSETGLIDVTSIEETIPDMAQVPQIESNRFALEARGITFSYLAGVKVLENVNLLVRSGTIHGLIGPNGSGKSTLVDILSGELSPDQGMITLNGSRVEKLHSDKRPALGLMRTFQTAVMVGDISTCDNVTIGLYHKYRHVLFRSLLWPMLPSGRRDSREMNQIAQESLRNVGLDPRWNRERVADIPHGVEQLTQLAAACAGSPLVLILDEPLAGLSTGEVEQVSKVLRALRESGVTIIVIEHQTRFIFDVCDEVTVLAAGQLVKFGDAGDVRMDSRVREVYLGQ